MKGIKITRLKRRCLRVVNGFLISVGLTLAGNYNFTPDAGYSQAAITGEIDAPYLGINLTIPNGWEGGASGDFLVFGSETEVGVVVLGMDYVNSVEDVIEEMDAGLEEDGVQLIRSSNFERIGTEGIGAEFSGYANGVPAKAFMAVIINPYGRSINLMVLTSAEMYGPRYPQLIREIASGLQFTVPKEAPLNNDWRRDLAGISLAYSAYDAGYNGSSGFSSTHRISLCPNKYFSTYSSESFSVDGGIGSTDGLSRDSQEGQWEIVSGAGGISMLQLRFSDGNVSEYVLDREANRVFLDGTRYHARAADCH